MNILPERPAGALMTLIGLGVLSTAGVPAVEAQRPITGFPRSDQSDVTGPAVTTGDQLAPLFAEPGTIRSMACPVAWGVRTASDRAQVWLTTGNLGPSLALSGVPVDAAAQRNVLALLRGTDSGGSLEDPVFDALVRGNGGATRQARRLVNEARGLFTVMNSLDPLRPGRAAPTQLERVTGAYNAFVDASADGLVTQPPAELIALRAVLDEMVSASIQNQGRPANELEVDASGLACAGLAMAPPPPPVVVPPADQPFEMCVLVNGDFRIVAGLRSPEGDSIVLVDGGRVPLTSLYPAAAGLETPPWVSLGEPVTLEGQQYQPFGVTRTIRPGEVFRRGYLDGYEYFTAAGEVDAPVIYFVSAVDCIVQPYRSVETIQVRG